MRVQVTTEFKDIHDGSLHKVGDLLTISKERYKEILQVGQFVEETKPEAEDEE